MSAAPQTVPTTAPIPLSDKQTQAHARLANAIRALSMDAVEKAKSGHPGTPMGMADVATALWSKHLKFDPTRTRRGPTATASCCRPATARCCSMRCCHLTGYADMTIERARSASAS